MDRRLSTTTSCLLWASGAALGTAIVARAAWTYLRPCARGGRAAQSFKGWHSESPAAAGEGQSKRLGRVNNALAGCKEEPRTPFTALTRPLSAETAAEPGGQRASVSTSALPTGLQHLPLSCMAPRAHTITSLAQDHDNSPSNGSGSEGRCSAGNHAGSAGAGIFTTESGQPTEYLLDAASLTGAESAFLGKRVFTEPNAMQRISKLGEGSGAVVSAVDVSFPSGRVMHAALKQLKTSSHVRGKRLASDLRREERGLVTLMDCPYAVQYLGSYVDTKRGFAALIMTRGERSLGDEVVVAYTLRKLAGRESCELLLPAHSVEAVLAAALGAAVVLHSKGLANLDFKPDNMLLTAANSGLARYVVSDLGLTTEVKGDGTLSAWGGTYPFRAPEMEAMVVWAHEEKGRRAMMAADIEPPPYSMSGPPTLTTAVDVFSIGALALSCAAFGPDSCGLVACLRSRQLPPYVPAALGGLILQLTDPDPRKRPTAEEALRRLEQL